MPLISKQLLARARKIKLLLMDVDGVLTEGHFFYVPRPGGGLVETKAFHSRDGLGFHPPSNTGRRNWGFIS
jgi:3-deoxy-D-manno-octulosonate 8-phosphate phosphatase (KDO 8-P phosphatase)